jgi:hypothetical protein
LRQLGGQREVGRYVAILVDREWANVIAGIHVRYLSGRCARRCPVDYRRNRRHVRGKAEVFWSPSQ